MILAGRGLKAQAIAFELGLGTGTVENYLNAARRRYRVHNSEQLLVQAILAGEISLTEFDARQ